MTRHHSLWPRGNDGGSCLAVPVLFWQLYS